MSYFYFKCKLQRDDRIIYDWLPESEAKVGNSYYVSFTVTEVLEKEPEDRTHAREKFRLYMEGRRGKYSNPIKPEELELSFAAGLLRKSELEDGKYYYGHCRNACVSKWNAKTERFTYMREKFGSIFPEDINHPEDDNGYDLFTPVAQVEPFDNEVIRD